MRFDLSRFNRQVTHTNVSIGRRGEWIYNGTDSISDTGSEWIGTKAITLEVWIKARSFGFNNGGRILDNGKLIFTVASASSRFAFFSDGATIVPAAVNSLKLDEWIYAVATRTALGITNLYVDGLLSSSANGSSGIPEAGTTNIFIGNNSAVNRTFDGSIILRAYNEIWTADQVAEQYDKEKRLMF